MRAIFISYRREDAEGQAGRLFDDLARHFGEDSVFMDVAGIEPGRDFRRVIDEHVASCGVLLAMIGKSWLDAVDESQRRRLEDPMDFVRLETASALKRDIPVVPVLVHGARMPKAEQLPEDLAELAYRNGVELTHARWDSDVQVLIKALTPYVESIQKTPDRLDTASPIGSPAPGTTQSAKSAHGMLRPAGTGPAPKKSFTAIVAGSLAALVIAAGGYLWFQISSERAAVTRQAALLEVAKKQADAELLEARRQAEAKAVADALETKKQDEAKAIAAQAEAKKRAKEIAAAEERDRIRTAQEKAAADKREADIKAQQIADARKREADARDREIALAQERERNRLTREKALDDERERIRLAQEKANAAQRASWPSRNFPPPNGGLLVYTIRPDGNPACASYDGGGCLWGLSYEQIDFKRLKPLACGQEHRARWGVTGYEDPKHWCNLARTKRVSRQAFESRANVVSSK